MLKYADTNELTISSLAEAVTKDLLALKAIAEASKSSYSSEAKQ